MGFLGFGKNLEKEKQKELMEKLAEAFKKSGVAIRYEGRYESRRNSAYSILVCGLKEISLWIVLEAGDRKSEMLLYLPGEENQRKQEVWNRIFNKFPCPCGKGRECGFRNEYFSQENIEVFPDINAIVEYFCILDVWFRKIMESPKPSIAAAAYDIRIESAKQTLAALKKQADEAYFRQVDNLLECR